MHCLLLHKPATLTSGAGLGWESGGREGRRAWKEALRRTLLLPFLLPPSMMMGLCVGRLVIWSELYPEVVSGR